VWNFVYADQILDDHPRLRLFPIPRRSFESFAQLHEAGGIVQRPSEGQWPRQQDRRLHQQTAPTTIFGWRTRCSHNPADQPRAVSPSGTRWMEGQDALLSCHSLAYRRA
jgi:hypothetical protein